MRERFRIVGGFIAVVEPHEASTDSSRRRAPRTIMKTTARTVNERFLRDAIQDRGRRHPDGFVDRRGDINHVAKLPLNAACIFDPGRQEITIPFRVPPKCEATCLVHCMGESIAWAQPTG
jgi:hypothetical protein